MENFTSLKSISFNIRLLQLFGTWPPHETNEEPSSSIKIKLYTSWQIFTIGFFFILYAITEVITMITVWGDLEAMAEASFLFLTHCAQTFKIYFMLKYAPRINNLFKYLELDQFRPKSKRQHDIFNKYMARVRSDTKLLMWLYISGCTMYSLFPFIDGKGRERQLPFRVWYPFDLRESLALYRLVYVYQVISVTNNAVHNAAMDTLISGLMVHICAQLALLKDQIENLKDLINDRNKIWKTQEEDYQKKRQELTKHCIQVVFHHWKIQEFLYEMESVFTFGMLAQFAASILILCITALQLTIVVPLSFEFFACISYLICMLSQIFLYCWHGNEIIYHSLLLPDAVYQTTWYDSDPRFKQYVTFLMINTQRPLKLRVGNFFTLSLDTFMAILRNSYSYFAVLKQMQNS